MSTDAQTWCERCKGASGCSLPRVPRKTACKAFEAFEYFVPAIIQGHIQPDGWADASRAMGLCGDCGNRELCMFDCREGGVWHCEEYR